MGGKCSRAADERTSAEDILVSKSNAPSLIDDRNRVPLIRSVCRDVGLHFIAGTVD